MDLTLRSNISKFLFSYSCSAKSALISAAFMVKSFSLQSPVPAVSDDLATRQVRRAEVLFILPESAEQAGVVEVKAGAYGCALFLPKSLLLKHKYFVVKNPRC